MSWRNLWTLIWYFLSGEEKKVEPPKSESDPPKPEPPKPPKPPDPPPVELKDMVLFDLDLVPGDMNNAGFPGREGVVLYALGQVANGWPIPGQSGELVRVALYYDQIRIWWEGRITDCLRSMDKNSGLRVMLVANDHVDRFGFRLYPPTYERFKHLENRLIPSIIIPESQYG